LSGADDNPSPLSAPRAPRYWSLDIWRGLACLVVVFYHCVFYAQPGKPDDEAWPLMTLARVGWLGVPMFFVISGYCISATADRSRRKGFGIRDYFWRRCRRIFPPYWIFVALAVVVVAAGDWLVPQLFTDAVEPIPRPWWRSGWQWLGNLTLTETWRHHVVGDAKGFFISPAWTLCYEEQFYLVTGLILWIARAHFFRVAAIISAAVAASCVLLHVNDVDLDGFFFDGRWLLFALGILVYWCVNYGGRAWTRGALLLFAGLAAWSTFDKPGLLALVGFDMAHDLQVAAWFALVILALHPLDERMFAQPWLWPLRICGQMCYSLYLLHWPIVKAITHAFAWAGVTGHWPTLLLVLPVATAASVAVSWWFHRTVEVRFLNAPIQT